MIRLRQTSGRFTDELFAANGSFVAVVMNYNKSGMVARAVKSAFAQEYPCYEILCLDDASTDGSAEEMCAAVEACLAERRDKALRVTVVCNEKNLTTLGQWRQAVSLAGGTWFGMFAADDEAEPDRILVAADLVKAYPGAAAVCTNFTDFGVSEMHAGKGLFVKRLGDYAWPGPGMVLGCTAFWRRDVLELDLPTGTMDDFILSWLAVISRKGDLVCDLTRSSVRYGLGSGVTTIDRRGVVDSDGSLAGWYRRYQAVVRRGRRFGRAVWDEIKRYDDAHGTDKTVSAQVRGSWIASWTESGGWLERLRAVWTMTVVDRRNDYGGLRAGLLGKVTGRFLTRLLGVASFVPAYYLAARWRGRSRHG